MRDAVRLNKESYRALLAFGTSVATDKYGHAKHCAPQANMKANRCGKSSLRPWRVILVERNNGKKLCGISGGGSSTAP